MCICLLQAREKLQMSDDDWSVWRSGALWFVVLAPFVLLATVAVAASLGLKPQKTLFPLTFWFWAFAQAALFGGAVAFWVHLIPCAWLACDLGPRDDGVLRGILWFVLWPVFTVCLLLPCFMGRGYGLLKRAY